MKPRSQVWFFFLSTMMATWLATHCCNKRLAKFVEKPELPQALTCSCHIPILYHDGFGSVEAIDLVGEAVPQVVEEVR